MSGVTVWWNFCLSVPFHAHVLLIFRGWSQQCFQPRTFTQTLTFCSHLLLPQPRHVSAPSAGGWPGSASGRASFPLVAVAADPLPGRLLVSLQALRHENGRRRSTLPACLCREIPLVPTYIMSHRLRLSGREAKQWKVAGMSARSPLPECTLESFTRD